MASENVIENLTESTDNINNIENTETNQTTEKTETSQNTPKFKQQQEEKIKENSTTENNQKEQNKISTDSNTYNSSLFAFGGIIKKAVSGVEHQLDRVLMESPLDSENNLNNNHNNSIDTTFDIDGNISQTVVAHKTDQPNLITSPKPTNLNSQNVSTTPTSSSARLTMQERLAKAVARAKAQHSSKTQISSNSLNEKSVESININLPNTSPKQEDISLPDSQNNNTNDISNTNTNPILNQTEIQMNTLSHEKKNSFSSVKTGITELNTEDNTTTNSNPELNTTVETQNTDQIGFQDEKPDNIEDFKKIIANQNEKIEALHSKLNMLAQQEAEAAKERSKQIKGKSSSDLLEKKLAQKEEQIALLMAEGEALSKKELKYMNIIKQLRSKQKDDLATVEQSNKRAEKFENEVLSLKEKLKKLNDIEKLKNERIKALTKSENELIMMRRENSSLEGKLTVLQQDLQAAQNLHYSDVKELESNKDEIHAKSKQVLELQSKLHDVEFRKSNNEKQFTSTIENLEKQLNDLKTESSSQITELKSEINRLETQLEITRSELEDYAFSADPSSSLSTEKNSLPSDSTDDKMITSTEKHNSHINLSRQIETLKQQYATASENWRNIETTLNTRIDTLEKELETSKAHENQLINRNKVLGIKKRELEAQLEETDMGKLEMERSKNSLESELKVLKSELEKLEKAGKDAAEQVEADTTSLRLSYEEKCQRLQEELNTAHEQLEAFNKSNEMIKIQPNSFNELSDSRRAYNSTSSSSLEEKNKLNFMNPSMRSNSAAFLSNNSKYIGQEEYHNVNEYLDNIPGPEIQINPPAPMLSQQARKYSNSSLLSVMSPINSYPTNNGVSNFSNSYENLRKSSVSPSLRSLSINAQGNSGNGSTDNIVSKGETETLADVQSTSTAIIGGTHVTNGGVGTSHVQLVERLSARVRHLESDVMVWKEEIQRLTRERDLAREDNVLQARMARTWKEKSTLAEAELKKLSETLDAMKKRESAALELLGERTERVQELEQDVIDLKALYRQQIEEFLSK